METIREIQRAIRREGLRLLPNTPIWLQHYALPREEAIAFQPFFAEAWRLIPLAARRKLLSHWRHPIGDVIVSPAIGLCEFLASQAGEDAVGYCTCAGHRIQYLAPVVRLLPPRPLLGLILHELAHALCYAMKAPGHNPPSDMNADAAEDEAYHTLEWWQVSQYDDDLDVWWSQNKGQVSLIK